MAAGYRAHTNRGRAAQGGRPHKLRRVGIETLARRDGRGNSVDIQSLSETRGRCGGSAGQARAPLLPARDFRRYAVAIRMLRALLRRLSPGVCCVAN